jgi:C-terminal processing protease CtpA/Prc
MRSAEPLTSPATISAAEQFTYDLKMLRHATIVGETTAGGAHAGVWHRIDDHYGMAIPENRAVNPYSKFDWEATGVQPDIKAPRPTPSRPPSDKPRPRRSRLHSDRIGVGDSEKREASAPASYLHAEQRRFSFRVRELTRV